MASVVDYLAIPDLMRFARVSRRFQDMVYDDTRWIKRLNEMGCWNVSDARNSTEASRNQQDRVERSLVNGKGRPEIIFNADVEHKTTRRKSTLKTPTRSQQDLGDGFDTVQISSPTTTHASAMPDREIILSALRSVKSTRGKARQEYGKVYKLLSPYYRDTVITSHPMQALIFTDFTLPEQQAQMLSQIQKFSRSDFSPGSGIRDQKIEETIELFDTAALLEFRKGYEYKDFRGRMRQYAHVMYILNHGKSCVDLFLHDNNLITQKANLGSVSDCIDYSSGHGELSSRKVHSYFERLGAAYTQENAIVKAAFPDSDEVGLLLLERVGQDILAPFLTLLLSEAKSRGIAIYLKTMSGSFVESRQFFHTFGAPNVAKPSTTQRTDQIIRQAYEPHLDLYLTEELESFKKKADSEVDQWNQTLSEQTESIEGHLMSNINRQADKKDFLTSFKKVIMMPVTITSSLSAGFSPRASKDQVNGEQLSPQLTSRPVSPGPNSLGLSRPDTPSIVGEAPGSDLAAKAALMTSRLENIRSLFSIEVALNLVHAAKSSLERIALFIALGGELGQLARSQGTAIFINLLQAVGQRHIKTGFDKAINHLATYNPREASANSASAPTAQVAPLATFLELVNIGDLIQQMVDVFYESELVRLKIANRDDFLDINSKEKKKFEAMLDERVAAGLGKGIDVLMDEVEYICATTQLPTDFNPENDLITDIGPTNTAKRVIEVVSGHTSILSGLTEKTLLDVFSTEVGLRLFTTLCKHIKRQRISTAGSLPLLSDLKAYATYIATFRNNDLNSYFTALREVGQIYLIEGRNDKEVNEMATIISDGDRYYGIFTVEEVVEFAERRNDWLLVRSRIEGKVKGDGCILM